MPVATALRRWSQGHQEFIISLGYIVSSRSTWAKETLSLNFKKSINTTEPLITFVVQYCREGQV